MYQIGANEHDYNHIPLGEENAHDWLSLVIITKNDNSSLQVIDVIPTMSHEHLFQGLQVHNQIIELVINMVLGFSNFCLPIGHTKLHRLHDSFELWVHNSPIPSSEWCWSSCVPIRNSLFDHQTSPLWTLGHPSEWYFWCTTCNMAFFHATNFII